MRTYQDIFTTVYNHLIEQGRQAVDESGDCVYWAKNGMKCAIGCLITDAAYDPSMEFDNVMSPEARVALGKSRISISSRSLDFLYRFQSAHDNQLMDGLPEFKDAMRQIAVDYNLEMP